MGVAIELDRQDNDGVYEIADRRSPSQMQKLSGSDCRISPTRSRRRAYFLLGFAALAFLQSLGSWGQNDLSSTPQTHATPIIPWEPYDPRDPYLGIETEATS